MPRSTWTGSISFGLVHDPGEGLHHGARSPGYLPPAREEGTGRPDPQREVSKDKTHDEVAKDDIELGYEISKGKYVTVDPDEVAELRPRKRPGHRRRRTGGPSTMSIPVYYERTYWLAPDGEAAEQLVRMFATGDGGAGSGVGIGSVVMRTKRYFSGPSVRSTARWRCPPCGFADEVVAKRSEIDGLTAGRRRRRRRSAPWPSRSSTRSRPNGIRPLPRHVHRRARSPAAARRRRARRSSSLSRNRPVACWISMAALEASVDAAKSRRPAASRSPGRRGR